jgi:hypothetical protein
MGRWADGQVGRWADQRVGAWRYLPADFDLRDCLLVIDGRLGSLERPN